jgi:hypothetical protein
VTSEFDAVRQSVDFALAADEVMAAVRELHHAGHRDAEASPAPSPIRPRICPRSFGPTLPEMFRHP